MSGTESFLRPSLRLRNCLLNDVECKLGQARASHRAEGFVLSLASHMVQDGFDKGVGFRSASDTVYSPIGIRRRRLLKLRRTHDRDWA